jgi:hypothetical protein
MTRPELFLDIETVPDLWEPLPSRLMRAFERAPARLHADLPSRQRWAIENHDRIWREGALDPMRGSLLLIGYAQGAWKPEMLRCKRLEPAALTDAGDLLRQATDLEMRALMDFREVARDLDRRFIGHHIQGFDVPFIMQRALRLNMVGVAKWLADAGRDGCVYDTALRWPAMRTAGGKRTSSVSLANIAAHLGLPARDPAGLADGAKVVDSFMAGRLDLVEARCAADIEECREIYNRLRTGEAP